MRNEPHHALDTFRLNGTYLGATPPGSLYGVFMYRGLMIISSGPKFGDEGSKWEHVSVSHPTRCPTWDEMADVKSLFWRDDETVLQFHPKRSAYVNVHPTCLHLWKQDGVDHQLPETWTLAPESLAGK